MTDLNKKQDGAINIRVDKGVYFIEMPFKGSFMRMADQFSGEVNPNIESSLQFRSLYSISNFQTVTFGGEGVRRLPRVGFGFEKPPLVGAIRGGESSESCERSGSKIRGGVSGVREGRGGGTKHLAPGESPRVRRGEGE